MTNPTRFVGLGTVPLQEPLFAVQEMKRCVLNLGFPGLQIGTSINSWNLDNKELDPFWKVRVSYIQILS